MKVLITGGFGFIGGRLANFLNTRENKIIICTRDVSKSPPWSEEFKKVEIDWKSYDSILEATKNIDVIIHLAALNAKECLSDPSKAHEVNCLNSEKLIKSAVTNNVKKIIYVSTIHVYGSPLKNELKEVEKLNPKHPYAKSHYDAEKLFIEAHKNSQIESNIIRLSNSFGTPENYDVDCWSLIINNFCMQAASKNSIQIYSENNSVRDFISMTDTCEAIKFLMGLNIKSEENCIFNVGGNYKKSVFQIAEVIKERFYKIHQKKIRILHKKNFREIDEEFNFNINKIIKRGFNILESNKIIEEIDSLINFCIEKNKNS